MVLERLQPLRKGTGGGCGSLGVSAGCISPGTQEKYVVRDANCMEWAGAKPDPFWKGRKRRLVPLPETTYKPCSVKINEGKGVYLNPRATSAAMAMIPCHGRKGVTTQSGWEYTHCEAFRDVYNKPAFSKAVPGMGGDAQARAAPSGKRLFEPRHNPDLWMHWGRDESVRTVPYCWPPAKHGTPAPTPKPVPGAR